MDVLLISPASTGKGLNESSNYPPVGLAYIAGFLEKYHYSCGIIDLNIDKLSHQQILQKITDKTKLIGIYVNSFLYTATLQLTTFLKEARSDIIVILGGPLPSAAPEMLLNEIPCDAVIQGEGEYALHRILDNIKNGRFAFEGDISGLAYRGANSIIKQGIQRITDLDSLPFPAYHLLPALSRYKTRSRKSPVAPIMTSRGCSYGCTFCSKDVYKRRVTLRSAQNVLEEVDFLVKQYGIKQLDILDDNFAQNTTRFEAILQGLIERNYNLEINLQSGIRVEILTEELLTLMKKAGIFKISIGVESGDEALLNMHSKRLDLNKVEEVVKIAKKMQFVVHAFFIIGLLGETEDKFNNTLNFIKKVEFDSISFSMAVPFIGTELYKMVEEKGHILINTLRNIDNGFYAGSVFYTYDNFTEQDIFKRYKQAYKEVYSYKRKLKMLLNIRSIGELVWLMKSALVIIKGISKK